MKIQKCAFSTVATLAVIFAMMLGSASAQFAEQFNYTTGTLKTVSSDVWTTHSGTTNFIQVTSGSLAYPGLTNVTGNKIDFLGTGEDVNRGGFSITSGSMQTAYYSAVVQVNTSTAGGEYFLHFIDGLPSSGAFRGRLFARTGGTGGVEFGIRYGSGDTIQYDTATTVALGTPAFIVVKLTSITGVTNDTADLFINPPFNSPEPAPNVTAIQTNVGQDIDNLDFLAIRQGTAGPTGSIDSIRVGTLWAQVTDMDADALVPVELSEFSIE